MALLAIVMKAEERRGVLRTSEIEEKKTASLLGAGTEREDASMTKETRWMRTRATSQLEEEARTRIRMYHPLAGGRQANESKTRPALGLAQKQNHKTKMRTTYLGVEVPS